MLKRMRSHCGDNTCASCVIAGDYIFIAHHAGGFEKQDIVYQTRAAFESLRKTLDTVNASFDDVVQINFYIKNIDDFRKGADVFGEYFKAGAPARMTLTSQFVDSRCLCQIDGIAYKPNNIK